MHAGYRNVLLHGVVFYHVLKNSKFCRLSTDKQSRVYLPEAPFPHDGYVKSGRLKYFTTTHGEHIYLWLIHSVSSFL